jgi:hypothetical protein
MNMYEEPVLAPSGPVEELGVVPDPGLQSNWSPLGLVQRQVEPLSKSHATCTGGAGVGLLVGVFVVGLLVGLFVVGFCVGLGVGEAVELGVREGVGAVGLSVGNVVGAVGAMVGVGVTSNFETVICP